MVRHKRSNPLVAGSNPGLPKFFRPLGLVFYTTRELGLVLFPTHAVVVEHHDLHGFSFCAEPTRLALRNASRVGSAHLLGTVSVRWRTVAFCSSHRFRGLLLFHLLCKTLCWHNRCVKRKYFVRRSQTFVFAEQRPTEAPAVLDRGARGAALCCAVAGCV